MKKCGVVRVGNRAKCDSGGRKTHADSGIRIVWPSRVPPQRRIHQAIIAAKADSQEHHTDCDSEDGPERILVKQPKQTNPKRRKNYHHGSYHSELFYPVAVHGKSIGLGDTGICSQKRRSRLPCQKIRGVATSKLCVLKSRPFIRRRRGEPRKLRELKTRGPSPEDSRRFALQHGVHAGIPTRRAPAWRARKLQG